MKRRDFLIRLTVIGGGIASARLSNAQGLRKTVRVGIATIQPRQGATVDSIRAAIGRTWIYRR
jgi:hypothetical protein